jgi:hypothetical protein
MLLDGRFIAELVSNLYPLSAGHLAVLITFMSLFLLAKRKQNPP